MTASSSTSSSAAVSAALDLACRHFGAGHAGIARHHHDRVELLAQTSPLVSEFYSLRQGDNPWMSPAAAADQTVVNGARSDSAHPEFSARVTEHRIRSYASEGLGQMRGQPVTLDLFATSPGAFVTNPSHREEMLTLIKAVLDSADRIDHLHRALETRELISMAEGIIMQRFLLTGQQSMDYLRRQSQQSQVKVRDVAAIIVAECDVPTHRLARRSPERMHDS